jgi:hypothetical protein
MRKDVEEAERKEEVRRAARAFRGAGAISSPTLEAIQELYPDDRSRVGPAFRVLLFLFSGVAFVSAAAVLAVNRFPMGLVLFSGGLGAAALTELQTGRLRRARAGAEEATAILAVVFGTAALAWLVERVARHTDARLVDFLVDWRLLFFFSAALSIAAVFRWGLPLFGATAMASAFLLFGSWRGARLCWIALGAVLAPLLLRASVSPSLAPSQRRAADAALLVDLLALYLAVHLGAYDSALLETFASFGAPRGASPWPGRWFFVIATAALPVFVLAAGIRLRRPLLLRAGLLLGAASLVTLRFYVHLAPLWVVLIVVGGLLVAAAMALHRYLDSGRGRERFGFTSEPLFESGSAADVFDAGAAAALAPDGGPAAEKPGFRGGGGEFGGGGATGGY